MAPLFTIGMLLVLLGLSGGSWHVWSGQAPALIPAGRFLYVPGALLAIFTGTLLWLSFGARAAVSKIERSCAHPAIWAIGLLCIFTSDWIDRPYGFFPSALFRGEIVLSALTLFLILRVRSCVPLYLLPIAAACLLWSSFYTASAGRLLFSDDHAMFLFRFLLLKDNFPSIPFWSPAWNAGIDARDFFATGALGPFLLASPLIYFTDPTMTYNLIVALLLWFVTPLSAFFAAKIFGANTLTCALSATLSVCSSLFWYRWTLKYGTMGFALSSAILPLVAALSLKVAREPKPNLLLLVGSGICFSLMILWTPTAIALIPPFSCFLLPRVTTLVRSQRHVVMLVLLVAVNAPWIGMMWKVSAVGKFLAPQSTSVANEVQSTAGAKDIAQKGTFRHQAGGLDVHKSLKSWQESASALNPLILLCLIPSLVGLPQGQRALFMLVTGWLILLGTCGVSLVPQLELDRMLVIFSVVMCYPVGRYCAQLLERYTQRAASSCIERIAILIIGAFLLASPLAMSPVLLNRTVEQYSFASPRIPEMVDVIRKYSKSGRALFTGCVLHQLSGGHLAPLALWSGVPLIASSYAHNIWKYEQIIPKSFLEREIEGILDYFTRMNTSLVFAHEPYWRTFLDSHPQYFSEVWRGEGFVAYQRLGFTPHIAIEGSADAVSTTDHSVTLTPLTKRLVLSYRYFPFITSDDCKVAPAQVAPDLTLLALDDCPVGKEVTLRSVSPIERLLLRETQK
jgi:hypothetical protein